MRFHSRRKEVEAALKKNARRGLQAAAIEIAGEAKKRTPVDTGRLRASIAWAAGGKRQHSDSHAGETVTYEVQAPEGTALIGTNVEYAKWVHENLNAAHPVGQAKFLESAARDKELRARELLAKALRGEL